MSQTPVLDFAFQFSQEWCKFDLEWALFKERWQLDPKPMQDSKRVPELFREMASAERWPPACNSNGRWYPDGVPVVYLSMHNTKQFASNSSYKAMLECFCSPSPVDALRR